MTLDVDPSAAADPAALDAADPLAPFRRRFVIPDPDLVYLDGNSLGRPPLRAIEHVSRVATEEWAGQLIRGWEHWLAAPSRVGDLLGTGLLGARPDEVVICDSTTVDFYRLASAALDARPGRGTIVTDRANFPTDRYVLEGLARDRDREIAWLDPDPIDGPTADAVAAALAAHPGDVALVTLSHVNYRSAAIADLPAITGLAHDAGALVLWDLSHSAGAVPVGLAEHGVDLAVGCTYKYLNGGPGAPAFAYLRAELQESVRQPIQGWMGHRASFEMGPGYEPAAGSRALLSGTPPILAMVPLHANLDMLAEAGIEAVRAKSVLLTGYVLEVAERWLAPLGVEVVSPREPGRRGGHVTLRRPGFEQLLASLWDNGVIPDYRRPDGIRIGPAPLSTSFTEVHRGMTVLRTLLEKQS